MALDVHEQYHYIRLRTPCPLRSTWAERLPTQRSKRSSRPVSKRRNLAVDHTTGHVGGIGEFAVDDRLDRTLDVADHNAGLGAEVTVGLVLIDRLLTTLVNRLDDPSASLRRTNPW